MSKAKVYVNAPLTCDTCEKELEHVMYDAATVFGSWANLCQTCYVRYGTGLGTGKGQRYSKQDNGQWVKTGG